MFYLTPQTFGVQQYLFDALQCGEVVWHFGLLKKGYGLCHGAAGNAYTFLALYRQTQDPKHLYRACVVREHERDSVMLKRSSCRLRYQTPGRASSSGPKTRLIYSASHCSAANSFQGFNSMVSGPNAPFSYSSGIYCSAALIRLCVPPQFADWCMNYGKHGCRTPDTPFSLFEGKMSHSQKSRLSGVLLIFLHWVCVSRHGRHHLFPGRPSAAGEGEISGV